MLEQMAVLALGDETGLPLALLLPPPQVVGSLGTPYDYDDDMSPSLAELVRENPTFGLVAGGGQLNPIVHKAVQDSTPIGQ